MGFFRKFIKFYILGFILLICGTFLFFKSDKVSSSCPFCNQEILERQKFYEDDLALVLCTHKPIVEPHFLIIPKRHIERFEHLSDEEILHLSKLIKKVHLASSEVFQTSSYLIHQKNGKEVGQSVPHLHFHFIGKEKGDDSNCKFALQMLFAYFRGPVNAEKLQERANKMQQAMDRNSLY